MRRERSEKSTGNKMCCSGSNSGTSLDAPDGAGRFGNETVGMTAKTSKKLGAVSTTNDDQVAAVLLRQLGDALGDITNLDAEWGGEARFTLSNRDFLPGLADQLICKLCIIKSLRHGVCSGNHVH